MPTQQDQAIAVANSLISLVGQATSLAAQIAAATSAWTNLSAATKLNALSTAAALTTGGLGTADGSPVTSDPVDTRVSGQGGLSRAMSANNIASLVTYLQGVQSDIGGSADSANGAAVQLQALCT